MKDQPTASAVYGDDLLYDGENQIFLVDGQPFTGLGRELADNGAVVQEDNFENGMQEGRSRYWYATGEPRGEACFRHDRLHGPTKEWGINGRLRRCATFEYGILVSERLWDEQGALIKDFQIKEGDNQFVSLQLSRKIHEGE